MNYIRCQKWHIIKCVKKTKINVKKQTKYSIFLVFIDILRYNSNIKS